MILHDMLCFETKQKKNYNYVIIKQSNFIKSYEKLLLELIL